MVKRIFIFVLVLFLATACQSFPETPVVTSTSVPATAVLPTATLPATQPPATDTPLPDTPTPAPTVTLIPDDDLSLSAQHIFLYPIPTIYAGDQVTFQVLAHVPENVTPEQVTVHIWVDDHLIVNGSLGGRNLAGDATGLFEWAWDTTGLVGEHQVQVVLDLGDLIVVGDENSENNRVTVTAVVNSSTSLNAREANATWVSAEGVYCVIHAVTGTAAYRDLASLVAEADAAIQQAAHMLGEPPQRKIDFYMIDRVIGQGGYAGSTIVVSYPDRQYSGGTLQQVLIHEATHILDRQFAPQRITFLAEGLAVWASGGHYKPEDLPLRMAALVKIGRYLPLPELINNFYPVQHEIGYLETAGFTQYLIDQYGWSRFRIFYSEVTPDDGLTPAEAIDVNLQRHYNSTLSQMEAAWLNHLSTLNLTDSHIVDLETTIRYYDIMRQYQIAYDPTAYFLTAWLPYPQDVVEQGNTADLTRHPQDTLNITLEVMLQTADIALRSGDYQHANILLDSISRVLQNDGVFIDPLALSYLKIVNIAADEGYEAQRVTVNGTQAITLATKTNSTTLTQLTFTLLGQDWVLSN